MELPVISLKDHDLSGYNFAIVIPCFNEAKRIDIDLLTQYIGLSELNLFCFVNDGSTDHTLSILLSLKEKFPRQTMVINNNTNVGKAESVRIGINTLIPYNINYICYWDADLSTPISEVFRLFNLISSSESLLFVFGSRVSLFGTDIRRGMYRHYMGRIFAGIARTILDLPIYDTQCGIKIFHQHLGRIVFKDPFVSKWLFDVEVFQRIKKNYCSSDLSTIMKEVPLYEWKEVKGSKITFVDFLKIPFILALFAVNIKLRRNRNSNNQDEHVINPVHIS